MFKNLLKYQLRTGLFFIPLIIIPVYMLSHNYFIVFLLLQARFFRVFQQNDFHFNLLYITGGNLSKLLKAYNLSWVVWFNLWFVIAVFITILWKEYPLQKQLIDLLGFNSVLFASFIVGNMLSNSDLVTIKNTIVRYVALSFIFNFSISMIYALSLFINLFDNSFWISAFLFIVIYQTWHITVNQHTYIKYIHYYL